MKKIKVVFFKTELGNELVKEWLKSLSKIDMKIIGEDIKTAELGWPLGMPLIKKIDKNLWEVRSHLSNKEIARVFFTVLNGFMVLLHGFKKKTQKTPLNELDISKNRRDLVLKSQEKYYE
jgi:phage-related protein